jgi:iron(III) transport system ATP-binding protein
MSSLVFNQVSHRFSGAPVLDRIDLEVGPGEIVCLLGPSGCGKTTTLRIAAGLERAQAGEIWIGGQLVGSVETHMPPEKRKIGMVFQDYALFPHLSVLENVAFGIDGEAKTRRRQIAMDLLARLDMDRYADVYPHRLSGGEQQRVALARALAPRPSVMLMDEPFANLDVRLRDSIREATMTLLKEEGAAVVMVTHDPEEAMRMADRIALMSDGRIVQCGRPAEFHARPASKFAATFFREMNVLEGVLNVDGTSIETPAGTIPLADVEAASAYDVIVPPESVRVGAVGGVNGFRIVDIRPVGLYDIVSLQQPNGLALKAYSFDTTLFRNDQQTTVALDGERVFVFPREKA